MEISRQVWLGPLASSALAGGATGSPSPRASALTEEEAAKPDLTTTHQGGWLPLRSWWRSSARSLNHARCCRCDPDATAHQRGLVGYGTVSARLKPDPSAACTTRR